MNIGISISERERIPAENIQWKDAGGVNIVTIGDTLQADILPDYGGMVSMVRFDGIPVLYAAPEYLGVRNARAGGIPFLFPFAGMTEKDCYVVNGKQYEMPLHGFLKDQKFVVARQDRNQCKLVYQNTDFCYERYYPYNFELRLMYRITCNTLQTSVEIVNRSCTDMPMAMGFHPYFATKDKRATKLEIGLTKYLDFMQGGCEGRRTESLALQNPLNLVFYGTTAQDVVLHAYPEGYCATISLDPTFKVVTVCTQFEGTSCIEPWQACPNAANCKGEGVSVAAGQSATFSYTIRFSKLVARQQGE